MLLGYAVKRPAGVTVNIKPAVGMDRTGKVGRILKPNICPARHRLRIGKQGIFGKIVPADIDGEIPTDKNVPVQAAVFSFGLNLEIKRERPLLTSHDSLWGRFFRKNNIQIILAAAEILIGQ